LHDNAEVSEDQMFGWGSPFQQPPEQELRFSIACLTADLWSIKLPVVVHYRIADGRILAREPNALALITQILASPIEAEASRLSVADANRQRESLRRAAIAAAGGRDELNSEIVRHIRSKFGIRIVDLFVNSPELGPQSGHGGLQRILELVDWTPEQKRLLSQTYLSAEAVAQSRDAISIVKV
jgi:hypothetical protein